MQRCGQLLSCVHARRDGSGCGETPRCPSCVLRRSALEAIRGQTTASCRAVICRETAQGPLDSHLLVTAGGLSWGGRRVAVVLLRDLPEVIANAGLVPVCAWCRRVCSDGGEWLAPGEYLAAHVTATHGMCPHCLAQWQANDTAAENPAAGNPAAGPPAP